MQNIYLTRFQIGRLNPISDKYNRYNGCYGSCFKYKGGVLKIFYENDIYLNLRDNIKKNMKRQSPIIIYPKKELFKVSFNSNKIITPSGYWMEQAEGDDLITFKNGIISGKRNIIFKEFESVYYDKFLPLLKNESICIDDLKLAHIFYGDNFSIVDTDSFCDSSLSDTETFRSNLMWFNKTLFSFFSDIDGTNITRDFYFDVDVQEENCIHEYIKHVRNKFGNNVNSFGELSRFSK